MERVKLYRLVSILITNIHGVDEFLICFISRFQGHETPIKLTRIQFFVGEQPIFQITSKAREEWMCRSSRALLVISGQLARQAADWERLSGAISHVMRLKEA